jgi:hypothetical protein
MRRLMLLLVAVGLLGSLAGCHHVYSHGKCDCEFDDHCLERSPWLRTGVPISSPAPETVLPPMKLPEAKKKDF